LLLLLLLMLLMLLEQSIRQLMSPKLLSRVVRISRTVRHQLWESWCQQQGQGLGDRTYGILPAVWEIRHVRPGRRVVQSGMRMRGQPVVREWSGSGWWHSRIVARCHSRLIVVVVSLCQRAAKQHVVA
jgi:hypothetical protein